LVPAFHRAQFAQADRDLAVVNIGGISNISLLGSDGSTMGFDCGPGNCLMDAWIKQHKGQDFDAGGDWAAEGLILPDLLIQLLAEPFFALPPPRSTGRDLFNRAWLDRRLDGTMKAVDVQASLLELSAQTIAQGLLQHGPHTQELLVCGGGALNGQLMRRLQALLPGVQVMASDLRGLPVMQVEAAAFAWLAMRHLRQLPGNLAAVTGARGPRLLGAFYPA
jgi:anhydro-N-acetylmuramic acid kinase